MRPGTDGIGRYGHDAGLRGGIRPAVQGAEEGGPGEDGDDTAGDDRLGVEPIAGLALVEHVLQGTDGKHFGKPQDVAFLPDGRILIADGLDNHRIIVLGGTIVPLYLENRKWLTEVARESKDPRLPHLAINNVLGLLRAAQRGLGIALLPDYLIEVKPTLPYGGTIVWEWHIWDHMIQDFSAAKNNFGVVASHPELIDVNGPGIKIPQFWNHVNGIDYNAVLDQIMISVRGNSELMVIDHGITRTQAATHAGGRYGKGGDILYRWGYAQQYDRGTGNDRKLYQQHHTHWIEPGLPGAGNILIFNNGLGRGYSSVDEIVPPASSSGAYTITGNAAFGPTAATWTYVGSPTSSFFSGEISGAQRLPNGNTLITEGVKGNLFEVTSAGEIVWRYVNPVTTTPLAQGATIPTDPGRCSDGAPVTAPAASPAHPSTSSTRRSTAIPWAAATTRCRSAITAASARTP